MKVCEVNNRLTAEEKGVNGLPRGREPASANVVAVNEISSGTQERIILCQKDPSLCSV